MLFCGNACARILYALVQFFFRHHPMIKKITNPDLCFLNNKNETQFDDIIINDDHIISAVKEMSDSSSAGPDELPSSFLKECLPELIQRLQILFRKSLDSGDIPEILKRAAIIPVFRGGDKTCLSNYRPISLTPVLIKVLN